MHDIISNVAASGHDLSDRDSQGHNSAPARCTNRHNNRTESEVSNDITGTATPPVVMGATEER